MAKKTSNGKVAAEIGTGLIVAAAAGYYFYGSKRAKKNRDVVAKELKADWAMIQKEIKKLGRAGAQKAEVVQKKAIKKGAKEVKNVVKKARTAVKKLR